MSVSALQSFTFVSQLWAAAAASALQSFVSHLWTSQALVSILKTQTVWGLRWCNLIDNHWAGVEVIRLAEIIQVLFVQVPSELQVRLHQILARIFDINPAQLSITGLQRFGPSRSSTFVVGLF